MIWFLEQTEKITGNTILHYWANHNLYNSAKVFIKNFKNVDITNSQGLTAAEIAWINENVKILQLIYRYDGEFVYENEDKLSLLWLSLAHKSIYWSL